MLLPSGSSGRGWSSGNAPAKTVSISWLKSGLDATYSSRLPLPSQKLQLLFITEFHENVDGPLVVIIMWADLDLASTSNPCSSREVRRDYSTNPTYDQRQKRTSFRYFPRAFRGQVANCPIRPIKIPLVNDMKLYVLWQIGFPAPTVGWSSPCRSESWLTLRSKHDLVHI